MAVFGGGFTLDAAQWVAKDVQTDSSSVIHLLGGLVDKSLVVRDDAPFPRYRLLETTRLYGLEQLSAAGELALALERHARAMDNLLKVPRPDTRRWRTPPAPQAVLGAEVDNARAALGWAIGCNDEGLVISLAAGCSHVSSCWPRKEAGSPTWPGAPMWPTASWRWATRSVPSAWPGLRSMRWKSRALTRTSSVM
jgi:predicted ATPase